MLYPAAAAGTEVTVDEGNLNAYKMKKRNASTGPRSGMSTSHAFDTPQGLPITEHGTVIVTQQTSKQA